MNGNEEIKIDGMSVVELREFKKLFSKFIKSYSNKDEKVSDKEWLKKEFKNEMPNWSDQKIDNLVNETLESIKEYDSNLKSIHESAKKGINKEQWFADKVSKAATGVSVIEHGNYLNKIDQTLTNGNAQMYRCVTTNAGNINLNNNLDGYIAEQYHVNTFNANAALSKSAFRAEVKVPDGQTYQKNSVDVVIKDMSKGNGVTVHQYQIKYGKDAKTTISMLKDHGEITRYSNQQIVVPPEQVAEVQKAFPGKTVVSQIGGTEKVAVTSNSISKEKVKELQLETQNEGAVPLVDWNTFNTKELALHVGKNAGLMGMQAAAITTGFSMAEQLIKEGSIDTEKTVAVALETGVDSGIKAATAGALHIGVEKGIISIIPKGTPIGTLANIACVTIENVKILKKLASGEISLSEALNEMGNTSVAMVYGLGWGTTGAVLGSFALSWIPVVGPVIGGLVGGMIGYTAGSKFGQLVFKGAKTVAKGAVNMVKSGFAKVKEVGTKLFNKIFRHA
ncbi:UbiA family prenyltransferase [Holdemanella porci]|uniref:UbiA family prenyltransferase n=1 Tax=Holdemanella porci TaxID=2652276 RepID=UPI003FD7144E